MTSNTRLQRYYAPELLLPLLIGDLAKCEGEPATPEKHRDPRQVEQWIPVPTAEPGPTDDEPEARPASPARGGTRTVAPLETVERVEAMLATAEGADMTMRAIADQCGVNVATVRAIRRGEHFWQQSPEEQRRRLSLDAGARRRGLVTGAHYLPSPRQIRRHCRRFLKLAPRPPVCAPAAYQFPVASARVIH